MFRFTIRDVLWLTVVVALAVCWTTQRLTINRQQGQIETLQREVGGLEFNNTELHRLVQAWERRDSR
jgi:hypothetical protein